MKLHLKWYQVGPTCDFNLDSVIFHVPPPWEVDSSNAERWVWATACPDQMQNVIPPATNGTICDFWFSYHLDAESCVTVIDSLITNRYTEFVYWKDGIGYVYFRPQFVSGQYHLSSMGWYWKPPYEDYAPSGMPDFDQKQDGWSNMMWQWTFCGPTAVANCFWWFDSKHNLPPGRPGDGNDQFPLVRDYEDSLPPYPYPIEFFQDDHDMWNVNQLDTPWPPMVLPPPQTIQPFVPGWQNPPIPMPRWGELVERLAWFMNTNDIQGTGSGHLGTRVPDMEYAIDQWLLSETYQNESSLADSLYETTIAQPTFAQIESLVEISEDVILLLGFWWPTDLPPPIEWWRVGGHYVTVAGVNSEDSSIALSDPFVDWAELGNPGRVRNGLYIPHSPPPHDPIEHNDAGNISHDIYRAEPSASPGGTWALRSYPASLYPTEWMSNFNGQNIPDEFLLYTQPWNGVSPVFTEVEYAVVISPYPDFQIDAVPETLKLMQTESGNYSVTITPIGGYSQPVYLDVQGMPMEVAWNFDPNPATPPEYHSWLNLSTSMTTPPGVYDLTIIGTDPIDHTDSTDVVLIVTTWHPPYMTNWIHSRYTTMAKTNYGAEGQTQIIAPSFFWHGGEYLIDFAHTERRSGGSIVIGNDSTNLALSYGIDHRDFTPSESLKIDTARVDGMLVEYGTAKYLHNTMPLEVTMLSVGFMDSVFGGGEAILQEFIVENQFMWPIDNIHFSLFLDWQVGDPLLNVCHYDSLYNYYYQYSTSPANEVLGVMRIPDKDTSIFKGFLAVDNSLYIDPQNGWRKDSLWACMTRGTWDNSAGPTNLSALLTSQPFRLEYGEKHLDSYWLYGYYMFGDKSGDPFQRFLFNLLKLKGYYRGDVNCDGIINAADVVYLINYLFIRGPAPLPFVDQGDVNIDAKVDASDIVYLINYLFIRGPQPRDYDRWLYHILMWRWGFSQQDALILANTLSTPPTPNTSLFCTRFRNLGKSGF
jgi:hypothetical protein